MSYTQDQLDEIWEKATFSSEKNEKNGYREDMCGAWIKKDRYAKEGDYGWEVDHIYPESKAIDDGISEEFYNNLTNFQPLHHENNGTEGKGDNYPTFNSSKVSKGTENINKSIKFTISITKQNELKKLFSK